MVTMPGRGPYHLVYAPSVREHLRSIRRNFHPEIKAEIEANLLAAFAGSESAIPLDMLANYLAGAQIALMQWWLEKRRSHTSNILTQMLHRLQRAAIRAASGLGDGE